MVDSLVFVFLGSSLPRYVVPALRFARKFGGLPVCLIGQSVIENRIRPIGVEFVAIEEFYDDSSFEFARHRLSAPHVFRDSFWVRALERLFVLEQYMKAQNLTRLVHAEADQLVFRIDTLLDRLGHEAARGLYAPLHGGSTVVASILYCNDLSALSSLTQYAMEARPFPNEMALLSEWARTHSGLFHPLPTIADLGGEMGISQNQLWAGPSFNQIGGVVDAAQLGQWVAGIDPRNVGLPRAPKTKYVDPARPGLLTEAELRTLSLSMNADSQAMRLSRAGERPVSLYNLHIHSKIHDYLWKTDPSLKRLIDSCNSEARRTVPRARRVQLGSALGQFGAKLRTEPEWFVSFGIRRTNEALSRRPSSHPYLSGDTFRHLATHSFDSPDSLPDPSIVEEGDVIFCIADLAEQLLGRVLNRLTVSVKLLLGNSDRDWDSSLVEISGHPNVSGVWAQNMLEAVTGAQVLPIGLENRWRARHGRIRDIKQARDRVQARSPRVMWAFDVGTNEVVRGEAINDLLLCAAAEPLGQISPRQHRQALTTYSFVAAPPGNGIDTHRAWEAMYLGAVPVILDSYMARTYELMGLPVWVVDSYAKLQDQSEQDLAIRYESIRSKFACQALWAPHWEAVIG